MIPFAISTACLERTCATSSMVNLLSFALFFNIFLLLLLSKISLINAVYTSEFVALFVGGNFSGENRSCNAYLSKSTNSLRSVLRKHVGFYYIFFCYNCF
jgi:hypothetical protein